MGEKKIPKSIRVDSNGDIKASNVLSGITMSNKGKITQSHKLPERAFIFPTSPPLPTPTHTHTSTTHLSKTDLVEGTAGAQYKQDISLSLSLSGSTLGYLTETMCFKASSHYSLLRYFHTLVSAKLSRASAL